jgi:hypothetical protein
MVFRKTAQLFCPLFAVSVSRETIARLGGWLSSLRIVSVGAVSGQDALVETIVGVVGEYVIAR